MVLDAGKAAAECEQTSLLLTKSSLAVDSPVCQDMLTRA